MSTLLFYEGFGYAGTGTHAFGTDDDLLMQWDGGWEDDVFITSHASSSVGERRYFTASTPNDGSNGSRLKRGGFGQILEFYVGFRIYRTTSAQNLLMTFHDGASIIGSVGIRADGTLVYSIDGAYDLTDGTDWAYISTKTVPMNAWTYIEFHVTLSNTAGAVEGWIDNVDAGGATTSQDTIGAGTGLSQLRIGVQSSFGKWQTGTRMTDIYVDSTTRRGPVQAWWQSADTVGSAANFVPNGSFANHEAVDDDGQDGDTTYVQSDAGPTTDSLTTSKTLVDDPIALQTLVLAKYTEEGASRMQAGCDSNGNVQLGDAVGLTSAYRGVASDIVVDDPNTATAWTAAGANAAEIVYKHV